MAFDINEHLPSHFAPESRVWIYQANRLFTLAEAFELEKMLEGFVRQWQSHGAPVTGFANLFFGRFIVLLADERKTGVSGCSTDSSVRLIKEIETHFQVNLFDRQQLAFYRNEKVEVIPMSQLAYATEHGIIQENTWYFDNTIQTLAELKAKWPAPAKDTWIGKRFKLLASANS